MLNPISCLGFNSLHQYPNPPRVNDYVFCINNNILCKCVFCRFALKSWAAQDDLLRSVVESLYEKWKADETFHPWENYIDEGRELLQGQQVSFNRPRQETDRLFMNIGGDDVIEMQHPAVPADAPSHQRPGQPMIRLGAIASGKPLVREDQLRLEFAARHQCIGTDTEFDQVILNAFIPQWPLIADSH